MTDKTDKHIGRSIAQHIGKSIVPWLLYVFFVAFEDFNNSSIVSLILASTIIFALFVNLIPGIMFALSYLFKRDADASKNVFYRSFNFLFWVAMVLAVLMMIFSTR